MKIIEEKMIHKECVRECCIKNHLYTEGTCEEYKYMLNLADKKYSLENLFKIASNICEHSKNQTIQNVMFLLGEDAVITFYHILN